MSVPCPFGGGDRQITNLNLIDIMRAPEEFKKQAELENITYWTSNDCSMCGVSVGTEIRNGEASYRSACDCAWSQNHSHGLEKVAERYNMQTNADVIKRMDEFWGFKVTISV